MEGKQLAKIVKFVQDRDNYDVVIKTKEANEYLRFGAMSIDSKQPTSLVNEMNANLDHLPNTKLKFGHFNRVINQRVSYAFGRKCTFNRDSDVCEILFDIDVIRKGGWFASMHGASWLEICFGEDGKMSGIKAHDTASCFEFNDKDDGSRAFIIIEEVTDEFGMPAEDILSVRVIEDMEGGESGGQASFKITQYVYADNKLTPTDWMQDVVIPKESFMEQSQFNSLDTNAKRTVSDIVMRVDIDPFKIGLYKQLKLLVDEYDNTASETFDFTKKAPRNPLKIKGYNNSLQEIVHNVHTFNVIPLEADGEAEIMESRQDIAAVMTLLALLDTAIYEQSGSVKADTGSVSVSGTAIRMKYAQLDIAAQYLQSSMLGFFKRARPYMQHLLGDELLEVIFDSDILVNESDTIVNIINSQELLSLRTQLENHPFVPDVEEELKRLKLEGRSIYEAALDTDGDGFVETEELDAFGDTGLGGILDGAPDNQIASADAANAPLNPSEAMSTANNQKRISGTSSNGNASKNKKV